MIYQLNQYASQMVLVGTSGITQYGVDFGFPASIIELNHDSTGLSFAFALNSSVASTNGPLVYQSEKRTFTLTNYVSKLGICTLSTTTSTAAGGVAQIRVQAWG